MHNVANLADAMVRKGTATPEALEGANNVFRVLHGFYGNLFLAKFSTGQLNDAGEDMGTISARTIWAHGLRGYDQAVIRGALAAAKERHPEFPPSFGQFDALCRACKPRVAYRPAQPALGMSQELRSRHAANARAIIAKYHERAQVRSSGAIELPQTLDGLKQAIANAVATAGGDEVAELVRLDRVFARSAP